MAGFRLLRRARADLLDIAAFTAERWGQEQAERYVTQLYEAFHRIVDFPALRRPYLTKASASSCRLVSRPLPPAADR